MYIILVAIRKKSDGFHHVKKDLKIYCTDKEIELFRSTLDVISIAIFGPGIRINIISEQQQKINEALDGLIESAQKRNDKIEYLELGKNQYKELIKLDSKYFDRSNEKNKNKTYRGYNIKESEILNHLDLIKRL